jgi:hypothetical protein
MQIEFADFISAMCRGAQSTARNRLANNSACLRPKRTTASQRRAGSRSPRAQFALLLLVAFAAS